MPLTYLQAFNPKQLLRQKTFAGLGQIMFRPLSLPWLTRLHLQHRPFSRPAYSGTETTEYAGLATIATDAMSVCNARGITPRETALGSPAETPRNSCIHQEGSLTNPSCSGYLPYLPLPYLSSTAFNQASLTWPPLPNFANTHILSNQALSQQTFSHAAAAQSSQCSPNTSQRSPTCTTVAPVPSVRLPPSPRTFSALPGVPIAPAIHKHSITTPIDASLFEELLRPHPNRHLAAYLTNSLRSGFRIGYTGPRLSSRMPNLSSAFLRPDIIDKTLQKEISLGRIAGPFPEPHLRCSGLGLVPKDGNDWRLIFHLSAPAGSSVNDSINPEDFTLHYHSIDDAINMLHRFGPGALMAKADLKSAFRLCPVHPHDWPLLGIQWRTQFFIDKCLPFGLRSSPYLFNLVADARAFSTTMMSRIPSTTWMISSLPAHHIQMTAHGLLQASKLYAPYWESP